MQLATVDTTRDEPLGVTLAQDRRGRVIVAFAHPADLIAASGLSANDVIVSIDDIPIEKVWRKFEVIYAFIHVNSFKNLRESQVDLSLILHVIYFSVDSRRLLFIELELVFALQSVTPAEILDGFDVLDALLQYQLFNSLRFLSFFPVLFGTEVMTIET